MSNVVPIITSDDRSADREKIRRYQKVVSDFSKEVKRLHEEKRVSLCEGFIFGLIAMLIVGWLWT